MAGSVLALPGAWVDWVVLPLLAAAYEEHDEAEDEHDGAPGEIEVDAHRFFVDAGGVAGEEAVEAHESADEEEDKAEGDADVESHESSLVVEQMQKLTADPPPSAKDDNQKKSSEDEVEDDEDGEDGYGEGCGLLVPAQVAFDGFGG